MKFYYSISVLLLGFFGSAFAEDHACKKILSQSSTSWINQTASKQSGSTINIVDAATRYGNCVDQDMQQLHAEMLKTGRYPLMGANGDFQDFSSSLKDFTILALKLTASGGTWDNLMAAYVGLYQKQFKLLFYAEYINNSKDPLLHRLKTTPYPKLQESKTYFEKIMQNLPPEKREKLLQSFNQLMASSSFVEKYVYDYAIFILQSPADKPFSLSPF
jgi:hypothetical protein